MCWWQLPASLPFVAPAAVAGMVLHGVKGRPWFAMLAFAVLVVALPVILAPALGTRAFSDLADWITTPVVTWPLRPASPAASGAVASRPTSRTRRAGRRSARCRRAPRRSGR